MGVSPNRARALARTGGFSGIELKFLDTSRAALTIPAPTGAAGAELDPATVLCLNAMQQGDGESDRDGRRIVMKSVYVTGSVSIAPQANLTTTDLAPLVYLALVLDTQSNGAAPNSEDIFTNPAGAALNAAQPMRNIQYTNRFKVLAKADIEMPQPQLVYDGTNIEAAGCSKMFSFFKKFEIPVNFTGTTGTIATVSDNSLHIIGYTNSTTYAPLLNYNSRVRYVG